MPPIGRIELIKARVAAAFGVSLERMEGRQRGQDIILPRQVAMLLCRDITGMSYPALGRRFHRDHTTVMNNCRAAEQKLRRDPEIAARVVRLRDDLATALDLPPDAVEAIDVIGAKVRQEVVERLRGLARLSGEQLIRELLPQFAGDGDHEP